MVQGQLGGQLRSSLLKKVQESQAEFSTKESKELIDDEYSNARDKKNHNIDRDERIVLQSIGDPLPLNYLTTKNSGTRHYEDSYTSARKNKIQEALSNNHHTKHMDHKSNSLQLNVTTATNPPVTFIRDRTKIYNKIAKMLEKHDITNDRDTPIQCMKQEPSPKSNIEKLETVEPQNIEPDEVEIHNKERYNRNDLSDIHTESLISEIKRRKERLMNLSRLNHLNYNNNNNNNKPIVSQMCNSEKADKNTDEHMSDQISDQSEDYDDNNKQSDLSNLSSKLPVSTTLKGKDPFELFQHDLESEFSNTQTTVDVTGDHANQSKLPGKVTKNVSYILFNLLVTVLLFILLSYHLAD